MRIVIILTFGLLSCPLISQYQFLRLNSAWDDNFSEWEITFIDGEEEVFTGYIQRKWPLRNNWEEWTYEINDSFGEIRTKWKGKLDTWELRGNNKIVEMRKRWRNDDNEWVVSYKGKNVIIKTDYYNNANAWEVSDRSAHFALYTEYKNDPRDWIIEDEFWELEDEHRLALIFIALFQSIPK